MSAPAGDPADREPTPGPAPDLAAPRLTLALGGGGARCLAHLGVLRALADRGLQPTAVTASSAAAFVGALWAAGHTPEASGEILREAAPRLFRHPEMNRGLLSQEGMRRALEPHLPERFEQLPRPLAVVATDAQRGERVVLHSGPLLPALLASNAFPGLFAPVELDGLTLVDGGSTEMVPVRAAQENWEHPVMAVDVTPPRSRPVDLERGERLPPPLPRLLRAATLPLALARKGLIITQSQLVRYQLAELEPRWLLRPELPEDLGIFDFARQDEAVAVGERDAAALLTRMESGEGVEARLP